MDYSLDLYTYRVSCMVSGADKMDRCQSSLAQTLPPEEAPVDRPYWSNDDPDMPLPFDLSDIISRVESLLWSLNILTQFLQMVR
ncbi:hypothetical protein NFI96_005601 [Prochilodus magdalenae]|nr:hypothetical protein NFI96_005601 [Prochilodus magdalenae]